MIEQQTQLAIDGGAPLRTEPLPKWPVFEQDEVQAVTAVLESGKVNYWTGSECKTFEQEYAREVGMPHAIACANGTLALELALIGLDIGPGDEVIVPCRTFIASASCVVARGAAPIIADIDPVTQNINADTIRERLTPRTRAVIIVHLAGWPCDMDSILALTEEKGLYLIEDCAQAHGAEYKGRPVGGFGDASTFSFCQDKIMTLGGEGGITFFRDQEAWSKAWAYKDHGKSYDALFHKKHPPGFRWVHESFGSNFRLTEMQAAIGRKQLAKLPEWIRLRRRNTQIIEDILEGCPGLIKVEVPEDIYHARYKYYICLNLEALNEGWDRERIMAAIQKEGIPCFGGSCSEINREKAFEPYPDAIAGDRPNAKHVGETTLMFMVHHTLGEQDAADTGQAIRKVMTVAAG